MRRAGEKGGDADLLILSPDGALMRPEHLQKNSQGLTVNLDKAYLVDGKLVSEKGKILTPKDIPENGLHVEMKVDKRVDLPQPKKSFRARLADAVSRTTSRVIHQF